MNYEKKYQEIIASYNQDKDRATVEDTFAKLIGWRRTSSTTSINRCLSLLIRPTTSSGLPRLSTDMCGGKASVNGFDC